jgi:hypothetical protein
MTGKYGKAERVNTDTIPIAQVVNSKFTEDNIKMIKDYSKGMESIEGEVKRNGKKYDHDNNCITM